MYDERAGQFAIFIFIANWPTASYVLLFSYGESDFFPIKYLNNTAIHTTSMDQVYIFPKKTLITHYEYK